MVLYCQEFKKEREVEESLESSLCLSRIEPSLSFVAFWRKKRRKRFVETGKTDGKFPVGSP